MSSPKPKPEKEEERKPGLLLQVFGTELSLWGFRTFTLFPGLLGRWPRMSTATEARFRNLDSVAAAATLRVFRGVLAGLWEDFEPSRYNIVFAAFRFFEEMVQHLPVLSGEIPTNKWTEETRTVQTAFVRLLGYRDYYEVLMTDFPAYLETRETPQETMEQVRKMLGFITGLMLYPPGFKNTIIAHYSLPKNALVKWEKIKDDLQVEPANLSVYDAPDNVQKLIFRKIEKLRQEQDDINDEMKSVREISRYLQRDDAGVMKPVHLEASIDFVLENVSGLIGVDKDPLKWLGLPHRLLFAVFKDIELCFIRLLSGAVRTRERGHQTADVFIFQPACLKSQIDAFGSVLGALQRINRQTGEINYTYEDYKEFIDRRPDDPLVRYINDVTGRSLSWLRSMTERLELLLRQHQSAREMDARGQGGPELAATAESPIEIIPDEPRFLPFADRMIVARHHLNGRTVREAVEDLLGRMYQCRYRFGEPELQSKIDSLGHFRDQSRRIEEELERLGVRGKSS